MPARRHVSETDTISNGSASIKNNIPMVMGEDNPSARPQKKDDSKNHDGR